MNHLLVVKILQQRRYIKMITRHVKTLVVTTDSRLEVKCARIAEKVVEKKLDRDVSGNLVARSDPGLQSLRLILSS